MIKKNIYSYEKLIHLKSKNSDIIDYMRIIYIITKPLPVKNKLEN